MPAVARGAIAPVYLLACLIFGGSPEGIWSTVFLQLAGLSIICWAAVVPHREPLTKPAIRLGTLVIAAAAILVLQLIPLPPELWAYGGIRTGIVADFHLLGMPAPWEPLSLTPYEGLSTFFALVPPIAMFFGIVPLKAYRTSWLVAALIAGTFAGVLLGILQVLSADPSHFWYLYPHSSFGGAPGFFGNSDHMATLLLIALPFLAAIAGNMSRESLHNYWSKLAFVGALSLVDIAGIALNRSLAGYLLLAPVLSASSLLLLRRRKSWRNGALVLAAVSIVAALACLESTSIRSGNIGQRAHVSVQSRALILRKTGAAIADFMPFGSGLGSFEKVYPLYERVDESDLRVLINHAHNDYAELTLELGLPGVILILLFLWWWAKSAAAVWRSNDATVYGRAAAIASATILIQSLVDFPLRTAAISACFAICLALLLTRRAASPPQPGDLRTTRHLVFE